VAGTPASGWWGHVRGEGFLREDGDDFGAVIADLRAYRAVRRGAFALRLRGGLVDESAGFYDRFHLGGLYTVRGYPSQSLSPAGGDTRFWTAALELRAPLTGPRADPRLLGVLFADCGDSWRDGDADKVDLNASVGWGLRLRVPWFDSVGLDFGLPIDSSPVRESFHANAALGWNF
jgi:outer membrane protein assembly factor BamA